MNSWKMDLNLNPHSHLWIHQVDLSLDSNSNTYFFKNKLLGPLVLLPHSQQFLWALEFWEEDILCCRREMNKTAGKE